MAKSGPQDVDSSSGRTANKQIGAKAKPPEDKQSSKENSSSENSTSIAEALVTAPPKTTTLTTSICIESLVKSICNMYEPDNEKAQHIYKLICEKLYEMKLIDESYTMDEFEGMRNQYQRALYHLVIAARGGEKAAPVAPAWPTSDITNDWSHYYREFDEIEFIAKGGFGQVYRVKHKLDGTEYAIKKIFIKSESVKSIMNYLSEVKTFASLNHSSIVQYKAAWLELGVPITKDLIPDPENNSYPFLDNSSAINGIAIEEHLTNNISRDEDPVLPDKVKESSNFEIRFEENGFFYSNKESSGERNRIKPRVKKSSISEGGNAICTIDEIQNLIRVRHRPKWATLYIQMALCQATLKQWLEKRNLAESLGEKNDSSLVSLQALQSRKTIIMEIFKQLLQGIEYIHSKGIVHHDIKPSNIFIERDNSSENGRFIVQLGDFGLACPLQNARHSLALGTELYAAPEQLKGKCDPMSDMYSVGIVLYELVENFNTDMERFNLIKNLQKGRISDYAQTRYPEITSVIKQLVKRCPHERVSASQLLKSLYNSEGAFEVIQKLKAELAERDTTILKLREQLKSLGVETT